MPPCASSAQTIRASLLASATMATIRGLRASNRPSHVFRFVSPRTACRITALAPMISNRLRVRSPIFDVAPSRCFPPVDRWRGVRPSQAAKSRPLRKVAAAGANAMKAVAVIGPIPGIVVSRLAFSSARARRAISVSSCLMLSSSERSMLTSTASAARAASGRPLSLSSICSSNFVACAGP